MKKLKIVAGIFAALFILCIARLSIAESEYKDMEIQPLIPTQATSAPAQLTQQDTTTYRLVDSYRIEQTSSHQ